MAGDNARMKRNDAWRDRNMVRSLCVDKIWICKRIPTSLWEMSLPWDDGFTCKFVLLTIRYEEKAIVDR